MQEKESTLISPHKSMCGWRMQNNIFCGEREIWFLDPCIAITRGLISGYAVQAGQNYVTDSL
jgi:hypothetical protein